MTTWGLKPRSVQPQIPHSYNVSNVSVSWPQWDGARDAKCKHESQAPLACAQWPNLHLLFPGSRGFLVLPASWSSKSRPPCPLPYFASLLALDLYASDRVSTRLPHSWPGAGYVSPSARHESLPIQLDSTQRSVSGGSFFPQSFHRLAFQCWVFCDGGPEPWLSGNVSHFQKKSTGDCSLNLISQIRIRFSHPKWSKKLSCIHILCIYLLGRTLWQLFEIYIYIYFTYVFYIYHFNICKCVITFKILHLNICVEGLGDRKK